MSTNNEEMTTEPNDSSPLEGHSQTANSKPNATTKPTAITVEHSLDVIADLISKVEADDPPTQTQTDPIVEPTRQLA